MSVGFFVCDTVWICIPMHGWDFFFVATSGFQDLGFFSTAVKMVLRCVSSMIFFLSTFQDSNFNPAPPMHMVCDRVPCVGMRHTTV